MASGKYVVVYSDGGVLKTLGTSENLPADVTQESEGIFSSGALADGSPCFIQIPSFAYVPDEE